MMNFRRLLAAVLMLVSTTTIAAGPEYIRRADQYSRSGAPREARCLVTDDDGTKNMAVSSGDSDLAWFPWKTHLVLTSSTATTCCLSMTDDTTIGAGAAAITRTFVTDANGDNGAGPCVTIPANGRRDIVVLQATAEASIGARTGICSTSADSIGGTAARVPCRVDGDCPGAGTCDTTPTAVEKALMGAILQCRNVATNPSLMCAEIER